MTAKMEVDLSEFFDYGAIKRGEEYFQKGSVIDFSFRRDSSELEAWGEVSGSGNQVYKTSAFVRFDGDDINGAEGKCSCPVTYDCKHVVALLLKSIDSSKWIEEEKKEGIAGDFAWNSWFGNIAPFDKSVTPEEPAKESILYTIQDYSYGESKVLKVEITIARILKKGGFGKPKSLFPESVVWARHANETDAALALLLRKSFIARDSWFLLGHRESIPLLEKLLETGRAFWEEGSLSLLKMAEPRQLDVSWKLGKDGKQRLEGEIDGGGTFLPTSPPWYLDKSTWECGPVITDLEDRYFPNLFSAPPLAPNEVEDLQQMIEEKGVEVPLPKVYEVANKVIPPTLHISLCGVKGGRRFFYYEVLVIPVIRASILYGNTEISLNSVEEKVFHVEEGRVLEIERDKKKEDELIDLFMDEDIEALSSAYRGYSFDDAYDDDFTVGGQDLEEEKKIARFVALIAEWKREGYSVQIEESFPFDLIAEQGEWYFDIEDKEQAHWFDVEIGVDISGEKINLLPILVGLIKKNPHLFALEKVEGIADDKVITVQLPDGRYISLPFSRIKGVISTLRELHDPSSLQEEKLRLPKTRAGELLHVADSAEVEWRGGDFIKSFAEKLQNFKGVIPVELSSGFNASLRSYQQEGFNWLQFLSEHQMGGILADDMGLGKTVQALAHIMKEKEKGCAKLPSLVIAPTSLMTNWRMEAEKFAPELKIVVLHGLDRKKEFSSIPSADLILTTYPLLARDREELCAHSYNMLILDEAQVVKNAKTKAAKVCREIKANHRLCLTGTPMENHLEELWSLVDFTNPGLLGNRTQFKRLFRSPIEKDNSSLAHKSLSKRIAPFMLRRTKEEVAKELPPKTEIIRTIDLEGKQLELYEGIRLSMHSKVKKALDKKGIASSQIIILDALLKLRQVCCDPSLLKLDSAKGVETSVKMDLLKEMLSELFAENRKILLFSSFTSMLSIIEDYLKESKIAYSKLTGSTRDRETPIREFQEGDNQIFLISLKAGGTGLNLTAADSVIVFDPWWNPAAENQAIDRAYRIGQDKPVFVYKLITNGTVEEKILKMQEKKKSLMDNLFDEKMKNHSTLTAEELEYLFEPLIN